MTAEEEKLPARARHQPGGKHDAERSAASSLATVVSNLSPKLVQGEMLEKHTFPSFSFRHPFSQRVPGLGVPSSMAMATFYKTKPQFRGVTASVGPKALCQVPHTHNDRAVQTKKEDESSH
jgi:hypothetical protein